MELLWWKFLFRSEQINDSHKVVFVLFNKTVRAKSRVNQFQLRGEPHPPRHSYSLLHTQRYLEKRFSLNNIQLARHPWMYRQRPTCVRGAEGATVHKHFHINHQGHISNSQTVHSEARSKFNTVKKGLINHKANLQYVWLNANDTFCWR